MTGQSYLALHRVIDLIIVVIALPLLAPLGFVLAVAVAVVDRHNPLVRLRRCGRNREELHITKLRTMRGNPLSGSAVTSTHDQRVTALGNRLRDWRLDEIPQTIDILQAKMALIGPRPEDPSFVGSGDPRWDKVLRARPGIAGLSQIVAAPWEAKNLTDDVEDLYVKVALPAKLAIDSWYVDNASAQVDWIIVTSLARMMLRHDEWTRAHDLISDNIPEAAALCAAPVG